MATPSTIPHSSARPAKLSPIKSIGTSLSRHWLLILNTIVGIWVILPWFAPIFMKLGWESLAKAVYFFYSFQCHQMPQRSFFLFGDKIMYSLSEVQSAGANISNPLLLRQFLGNPEMGWKVAWSDRMTAMYTSVWLGGLLYAVFRKRVKPLSLWMFALLSIPMGIDGGSHLVSDFAGLGQGFRDTNAWLQTLTNNAFSMSFYIGDALGSFNSWMRLFTGALFGLALAWLAFPSMSESFVTDDTPPLKKG